MSFLNAFKVFVGMRPSLDFDNDSVFSFFTVTRNSPFHLFEQLQFLISVGCCQDKE